MRGDAPGLTRVVNRMDGGGQTFDGLLEGRGVGQQYEVLAQRFLQLDQLRFARLHLGDHLDRQADRVGQPRQRQLVIPASLPP